VQDPKSAKNASDHRFSKLRWLMFFRAVVVTLLLGATAILEWRAKGFASLATLSPLYYLLALIYGLTIFYALLQRRLQNRKAFAYGQILGDVGFITLLIYFTGGIESIFSWVYILSIFSAGTILYRRGALLIASASSILYGTLLDLHYYRLVIPPPTFLAPAPAYPSSYVFYLIAVNMVAFFLVALLSAYLAEQVRQKEEELSRQIIDYRQLEELYRLIVQNVTSGLITIDEKNRITSFNRTAEEITGYRLEEVYQKEIGEIFPKLFDGSQGLREASEGTRENRPLVRWETQFRTKEGKTLTLGFSASPLREAGGQKIGSVIIFQDLTKLREMEDELKRADRLAAIGTMAAGMAHEIRNPLASISGSIEILREESHSDAQRKKLMDIILREVNRLNSLVEDFLLFARPSSSSKEVIQLKEVLEEILKVFAHSPDYSQGIKVIANLEDPVSIQGDPKQIRQVFWNLLINSAQSMPHGGELRVELRRYSDPFPLAASSGRGEVVIRDTGNGISEEDLPKIFDPFFSTKKDGTGLGLSIVHRIVEGHGGKISVRSQIGRGTTFTIHFPIDRPSTSSN
jgi:two-component system sensor histidine kinase PilS (NtrC family)